METYLVPKMNFRVTIPYIVCPATVISWQNIDITIALDSNYYYSDLQQINTHLYVLNWNKENKNIRKDKSH